MACVQYAGCSTSGSGLRQALVCTLMQYASCSTAWWHSVERPTTQCQQGYAFVWCLAPGCDFAVDLGSSPRPGT
jgi:hypothetical protein